MLLKSKTRVVVMLVFLVVSVSSFGAGEPQVKRAKGRALGAVQAQALSEVQKPQLVGAEPNPVLRYPVAVREGGKISCGWLDIARRGIRYTEEEAAKTKTDQGFQAATQQITDTRLLQRVLQLTVVKRKIELSYIPQVHWDSVRKGSDFLNISERYINGTASVALAIRNFEQVYDEVKPPLPALTLRAEPATIERGHSVTLVWTSANAASLELEPGGGTVATEGSTTLTPDSSTTYTLTATGPGGTKIATARVTVTEPPPAVPPTIVLVEPSGASSGATVDVTSSPLTIRGVTMDNSGIPAVTINGSPAALRPKSAQAAEFSSEPIVLQPGENRMEISAVNAAHAEAKVAFVARFTPPAPPPQPVAQTNPKGLGKADILDLLKGDVPSARVAALVKEKGLKWVPTDDDINEIRAAGGSDELVDALKQATAPK